MQPIMDGIHELVRRKRRKYRTLTSLVNDIIDSETNIEHVITFLDQSPSAVHRSFANDLRILFHSILRQRLATIKRDIGNARYSLYAALLDMHQVDHCPELLRGILTINYDEYIEAAISEVYVHPVDFGIALQDKAVSEPRLRLLKLHGSFTWNDHWPVSGTNRGRRNNPLWIPPGIRKSKEHYPFNVLWGLAREMLDCDVLRIVGCNLGPTDWDLISMLFTTRHTKAGGSRPYRVEVIDSPQHAFDLQTSYPYLDIRSIFKILDMDIGEQLVAEVSSGPPHPYDRLSESEQAQLRERAGTHNNWFRTWLKHMAEAYERDFGAGSTKTESGAFSSLLQGG